MLKTKIRKLRRMSPAEIGNRLREVVRRSVERQIWKHHASTPLFAEQTPFDAGDMSAACQDLIVGSQSDQVKKLQTEFQDYFTTLQNSSQQTTEDLLAGKRSFLGIPASLKGIDWHTDPKTNHRWQSKFHADIPFGIEGPDVKYTWELSRHQFLADLANGWVLTANCSASDLAESLLLDWISKNRLYEGVNWISALEAGMRSVSWTWTVAGLNELSKESLRKIANSLADHATYLQHHLSYFSSPYNHLIGEAVGLYCNSFVLRQHPKSERWRRLARAVLEKHTPRQFYSDGFCVEQATGYHFYTLGFLTLAVLLARREGRPLTGIEEMVHRGYVAAASFRMPDGQWPAIGDLDSARSIPVFHQNYWQFGSLCSLAAVLFDDPSLISDSEPGSEVYWLLGTDGLARWKELSTTGKKKRQNVLPESGYAVASKQDDWLLFDAGPVAGGLFEDSTPSTAHGHADTLQVMYYVNGSEVLHDAGIHSYSGDTAWVNYFRSPSAHNTFEVQGAPVAKVAGKLAWSNVAQTPKISARLNDDVWLMCGSIKLCDGISASRYVLGIPDAGIWIADWIESDVPHDVTWYWQLCNSRWQTSQQQATLWLNNDQGMTVKIWSQKAIDDWQLTEASDDSPIGWRSLNYGSLHSGSRLSIRVPCEKKLLSVTNIGRATSPIKLESVSIQGQTLNCQPGSSSESVREEPQAEAVWRLRDPEGTQIYFAGLDEDAPGQTSALREIGGVGEWRVFSIRRGETDGQQSAPAESFGTRSNP